MKFLATTVTFSFLSSSLGFQTRPLSVSQRTSPLSVLPIEHLHDVHSVLTDSPAWSLLADAASATLSPDNSPLQDAVENAAIAKDQGWWQAYISLFKEALNLIHDTIDGPLKAQGVTNSWGISIAIFTACEFCFLVMNTITTYARMSLTYNFLLFHKNSLPNTLASPLVATNKKCRVFESSQAIPK
jgi:hypothetical protein